VLACNLLRVDAGLKHHDVNMRRGPVRPLVRRPRRGSGSARQQGRITRRKKARVSPTYLRRGIGLKVR
jgi:hypothetical protein